MSDGMDSSTSPYTVCDQSYSVGGMSEKSGMSVRTRMNPFFIFTR